ncbi:hypothetical protein jhhlp_002890 [Lomentospora prolificans]|uniref:Uncharacterized protein n=1 Tax=Lomentospora prolificans TaxID=41688 RepID=A0A2N3NFB1_9PEZI|nr:hypothetical protein jhhlp_002890 [Lomentospora prolificans]
MKDHMVDAGFVHYTEHKSRLPMGAWCRDRKLKGGQFFISFVDQSLEGFALYLLTQVMRWNFEECRVSDFANEGGSQRQEVAPHTLKF